MVGYADFVKNMMSSNDQRLLSAADLGTRALIISAMTGKTADINSILNSTPFDLENNKSYLQNLVTSINVNIKIIQDFSSEDFTYGRNDGLLIVLYRNQNNEYFEVTPRL